MAVSSQISAEKPSPDEVPDIENLANPTTAHIKISTPQKWHLSSKDGDGDTALALFSNPYDLREVISPDNERALQ